MIQVLLYITLAVFGLVAIASAVGTGWIWFKAWRAGRLGEMFANHAEMARASRRAPRRASGPQPYVDPAAQLPAPMYGDGRITLNPSDHLNPIGIDQMAQWDDRSDPFN